MWCESERKTGVTRSSTGGEYLPKNAAGMVRKFRGAGEQGEGGE